MNQNILFFSTVIILWTVVQSCLALCDPWTVACRASLSMEFSRQGCWSGLSFPSPGSLPSSGIKPASLACLRQQAASSTLCCPASPLQLLCMLCLRMIVYQMVGMTSPTQRTWVWANSGGQWRAGKPGLQFLALQRVGHNLVTEQHQHRAVSWWLLIIFHKISSPPNYSCIVHYKHCVPIVHSLTLRGTFPWCNLLTQKGSMPTRALL